MPTFMAELAKLNEDMIRDARAKQQERLDYETERLRKKFLRDLEQLKTNTGKTWSVVEAGPNFIVTYEDLKLAWFVRSMGLTAQNCDPYHDGWYLYEVPGEQSEPIAIDRMYYCDDFWDVSLEKIAVAVSRYQSMCKLKVFGTVSNFCTV